jgi:hypothetical protein
MPIRYENQWLLLFGENNVVHCENNMKRIQILYGQNFEYLC